MAAEKIILIDTDAGLDDAVAIFLAVAAHKKAGSKVKLVGITCVNGNTGIDNVCKNVTRTLEVAGMLGEIPIYKGCSHPMVRAFPVAKYKPPFHGEDGFGDAGLAPIEAKVEPENAVNAIIRLAKAYSGKLSVVALGPLTNLGMAVRLDPSIKNDIKDIYLMGGNCEGVGNISLCGEFNFTCDPEAAYVTLSAFPCPIVIAPWEMCIKAGTMHEFRTEVMAIIDSPMMNLLNKIEKRWLDAGCRSWMTCDFWALAFLIEPKLAQGWTDLHCTIELNGKHTRGLMVIDHYHVMDRPKNKRVITKVDTELCKKLLLWAVGGGDYELE